MYLLVWPRSWETITQSTASKLPGGTAGTYLIKMSRVFTR